MLCIKTLKSEADLVCPSVSQSVCLRTRWHVTDLREYINNLAEWVLVLRLIVFNSLVSSAIDSWVLFRVFATVFPVLGKVLTSSPSQFTSIFSR